MSNRVWVGVDLDGTLAKYTPGDWYTIGDAIEPMVQHVASLLNEGMEVRIFTARVSTTNVRRYAVAHQMERDQALREITSEIEDWCMDTFGVTLPVTAEKDGWMIELYDDRAVQVEFNTGQLVGVEVSAPHTEAEWYQAVKGGLDRLAKHYTGCQPGYVLPDHAVHDLVSYLKGALDG